MKTKRVVIVGCGIAGPVLGLFLKRAGIDSVICERRSPASREGAFLGVAPNGMNVLAKLDLQRPVERIGFACRGFEFQNACGNTIASIDRADDDVRLGAHLQMVRRGDLHQVLTDAARAEHIALRFGQTLVGIRATHAARVVAEFSDGECVEGDALIGCDGINSTARRIVLPDAPAPSYSGLLDYGGFATCPDAPIPVGINVMVFGRRAFFGAFKTSAGEVWWFHNAGERQPEAVVRDPAAARAHMLSLHARDPFWIRAVIESTPDVLGPFALNDILSLPRWHAERVCLAGDAAHATTPSAGQGASLALEDALTLAQCLRDVDNPERAFGVFERLRRTRVEEIVRQSRRNGSGKAVSGTVSCWIRDRLLPFFLKLGAKAQQQQYGYRIDWTQRVA
jgi:2-polyprenyl-6-methoxyphenol hydroxylase-like FAD-dependent oxidoreductase